VENQLFSSFIRQYLEIGKGYLTLSYLTFGVDVARRGNPALPPSRWAHFASTL